MISSSEHNTDDSNIAIHEATGTAPQEGMAVIAITLVSRETEPDATPFVWRRIGFHYDPVAFVGVKEIAALFHRSTPWASAQSHRRNFPKPVATLGCGPIWDRAAIELWRKTQSEGR